MKYLRDMVEMTGALFLAALVVVVLVEVVARYVLQIPISWPEELARYLLVWLTFLGAAAAAARHKHIVVDLLTPLLPAALRRFNQALAAVCGLIAVGILVWAGIPLFGTVGRTASPATGLELRWVFLVLPVSGVLLILFLLSDLGRVIRGNRYTSGSFSCWRRRLALSRRRWA